VSLCVFAACGAGLCGCRSGWHALCRSVGRWCVCVCGVEGVGGAFGMLTDCGCASVSDGMCGWDASVNGIGAAASDRVPCATRLCAAAARDAPLVAARCRLALAMGLASSLCEHSVLADCPMDCISRCGAYCSTQLAIRWLVAMSAGRSGAARGNSSTSVAEEGVPPAADASNA
jgi:hypothetical protein